MLNRELNIYREEPRYKKILGMRVQTMSTQIKIHILSSYHYLSYQGRSIILHSLDPASSDDFPPSDTISLDDSPDDGASSDDLGS